MKPGVHPLGLASPRDGSVYVPDTAESPAPLIVAFHGAGGNAEQSVRLFLPIADELGAVVLALESRAQTWDVILGGYGPDVEFLQAALMHVVQHYAIAAEEVIAGGVSDGASYALSIGLSNPNVFSWVVAFSPGFCKPLKDTGTPGVFMSHGTRDPILPIDATSRRLAPLIEQVGCELTFVEFDGGHTVPLPILDTAADWLRERLGRR